MDSRHVTHDVEASHTTGRGHLVPPLTRHTHTGGHTTRYGSDRLYSRRPSGHRPHTRSVHCAECPCPVRPPVHTPGEGGRASKSSESASRARASAAGGQARARLVLAKRGFSRSVAIRAYRFPISVGCGLAASATDSLICRLRRQLSLSSRFDSSYLVVS